MLKLFLVGALVFTACSADDDPAPAPDAAVCKNAFDERCMADNGCGVQGGFCCYRFNPNGSVLSVCVPGLECTADICTKP